MNPLARDLARRIKAEGPLSIADYMAEALGNPTHGYYMTREPFGLQGDFVTAPEISQMFGELIGLWIADYWLGSGTPGRLAVIELGPGRGTLMADALRAMKAAPGLPKAISLHLVEMSPRLRALQGQNLAPVIPAPQWHDRLAQAIAAESGAPVIIIANEFFDALPIHQLIRTPAGWVERRIGLDAAGENFIPLPDTRQSPLAAGLTPDVALAPVGSIAEICPAGLDLMGEIAHTLNVRGGAALIIDYGTLTSAPGDSLQAMSRHQFADPFKNPGEADITAHVDFAALSRAAMGRGAMGRESGNVRLSGPISQADYLINMGLETRAAILKRRATKAQAHAIDEAVKRLTGADEMGRLFKVLGLSASAGPNPAGFAYSTLVEDK